MQARKLLFSEIEARLLDTPGVAEAVVVARDDPPGAGTLAAFVVADFSQLKRLHRDDPICGGSGLVAEWKAIVDSKYSAAAAGPSFVGWDSSYTGEPIPEEAMREWLSNTVDRISALAPRRVLEMGCGAGLLVERLAPRCEVYRAADLSAEAIKLLRVWLGRRPDLRHVRAQQCPAEQISALPHADYDTVILNSVVQYFPDVEYLDTVLEGAISHVGSAGRVFVGDVRHLGLLRVFHSSVQLARAASDLSVKELRTRITRAIEHEKELLLDPRYFEELPKRMPRISAVHVLPKRGNANTEMTRYRYDVVLHVGEVQQISRQEQLPWPASADVLMSRLIDAAEGTTTVDELRKQPKGAQAEAGAASPEAVDAPLANDPWMNILRQRLVRELRQRLQKTLPSHRVPGSIVVLDSLAQSVNGESSRRA